MNKRLLLVWLLFVPPLWAQEMLSDRLKGLRVYGSGDAGLPVAGLQSRPVTIEFDVVEATPPDLRVRVLHCDRDWNTTQNNFINDNVQNRSKEPLHYEMAPAGVQFYRYHYSVSVPGIAGIDRFAQSGNYVFEITDNSESTVLGRGRFFVAEDLLGASMKVSNRLLPSEISPYNQVNRIEIEFVVPQRKDEQPEIFYPVNFKTVDVYRNRQLSTPWRIDVDDNNPNTFVEGMGTMKLKFIVDNVSPGSSYRRIDVTSVDVYPEGQLLNARRGPDVSRFQLPAKTDHHGTSVVTVGSRYADFVSYRFELLTESRQYESVYVVGDFNGWIVSPSSLMTYDLDLGRYIWQANFRRGAYDYQYVVGPNDWVSLEGNDWRTKNVFTAFIYYHDSRYGGFDRILGSVQILSPGGDHATTD
ncbi:MAG TPA: type IX secretion system plug protein domain-containing protein [Bacteroidota bacterium]|nr:type IX secretion system plug protein domain-containing protein [Bacteroidota bacterium]